MNEMLRRSYGMTVRAQNDETRSVDVVASSMAIDGYGEIVAQDWDLKRYKGNPVVLYGHNSWGLPIGFAENVRVEEDKLLATLKFVDARANPLAEQVWQGIVQGSLRAVSVGFRSKAASSKNVNGKDVLVLTGNELMEISVVPIPANPEALATEAKAFDDQIRALMARSQETDMKTTILTLSALLPILCLAANATEEDAIGEIGQLANAKRDLLAATGKTNLAEAIGVVQGWKAAAGKVDELQGKVTDLQKAAEQRDRDDLIAKARAAGKLAPAMVDWAKSCPLDTLRAFVETAPAIPQFKSEVTEPSSQSATLEWNGKKWADLSPSEKHELHDENHDLYVAMRDAAKRAA